MKLKKIEFNIILFIGVPLIVFLFLYFQGKSSRYSFYKESSTSKVISKNTFLIRTVVFHLDDGLEIYSTKLKKIDIEIGDSISKGSNNWVFKVFKKDGTGDYKFYKSYDYRPND